MSVYQKGKIYKITSRHTEKCYVGSTISTIGCRLSGHKFDMKRNKIVSSSEIIKLGDYEIILLELYPCNSKEELHLRERYYIDNLDCVNLVKPRTKEEAKLIKNEMDKEYRIKNKDDIKLKRQNRITCECGRSILKAKISVHIKSERHKELMRGVRR